MSVPPRTNGKRKRSIDDDEQARTSDSITVQVITGSYERVLHGLTVTIPNTQLQSSASTSDESVLFSDAFLFHAHASSVRCLALSPPSASTPRNPPKRILATGGTDERINLFSISASLPPTSKRTPKSISPHLLGQANNNRELGALTHHSATVSDLYFPSRSKLLSCSYDNTIAVTRVRDWSVLSTIRAPLPKAAGRPSGDTAGPGEVPSGINAIAVHPSAKLCLSVGQGEKSMRLWNLVTGKKAGVLTFDKKTLTLLGEGRWRGGEGRNVVWSQDGEEFAVGFERGALVYGQDCQVKGVARVIGTKVCQLRYVGRPAVSPQDPDHSNILVVSTEDGRLLFFDSTVKETSSGAPLLKVVGQLGSSLRGNRIKDFEILPCSSSTATVLVTTGSSDGAVTVWRLDLAELAGDAGVSTSHLRSKAASEKTAAAPESQNSSEQPKNIVGDLLGTYQSSQRITCLTAFVLDKPDNGPAPERGAHGAAEEWTGLDSEELDGEDDNDDDDVDVSSDEG